MYNRPYKSRFFPFYEVLSNLFDNFILYYFFNKGLVKHFGRLLVNKNTFLE